MPLFRWGAVAATAVVVVGAVSLNHSAPKASLSNSAFNESPQALRAQSDKVIAERDTNAREVTLSAPPNAPQPTKRAPHLQEQVRYERLDAAPAANEKKKSVETGAGAIGGVLAKTVPPAPAAQNLPVEGRNYNQLVVVQGEATKDAGVAAITQPAGGNQAATAAPTAAQKTEAQNAWQSNQHDETVSVTARDGVAQMNSATPAPAAAETRKKEMLANKKPDVSMAYSTARASTAYRQTQPISSVTTGTNWQITNTGQLQRAYFGSPWANMLSDHTFRSVAVIRDQVWAGGDNGLLFFSADNGLNWTQLSVHSGTTALSGNIVRLRFSDGTHGTVETSTGDTWITTDGGQSWQKR